MQCKPVINDSVLPNFNYLTNEKIEQLPIENEDIISLIRKLNPNKANGSDGISGQMLLLCDDAVILPLKIIFRNILSTAIYPDMWKLANVFTKGVKQLKTIDQYLSFQFVVKYLKKLSLTIFTIILLHITLSPETNLDFDLAIPLQTN